MDYPLFVTEILEYKAFLHKNKWDARLVCDSDSAYTPK